MFNLERSERAVIIFLISTLLAASAIIIYSKARSALDVRIGTFETPGAAPAGAPMGAAAKAKVNINEAGIGELMTLKGVGKVIAGRIVEYRDSKGLFISIEDLKKVRGVGPALFEKIKDDISAE